MNKDNVADSSNFESKTEYLRLRKSSKLKKGLSFKDLLFLSLGGQAPFLSLLTYATSVILYSFLFSPIIIVFGMLLVLINGIVVSKLSKKYEEGGGYYIYAMYSLTRRLGLETGWMYIFYSSFYGAAYIIGSSFVLHFVFNLNPLLSALIVFIPASTFLIIGIKPSAKYAELSGIIEIIVIAAIFVISIYLSNFHFFNPIQKIPPLGQIAISLLFAIGIPTGYGSITPLSEESINSKDIGRVVLLVIIIGGLITSLAIYGIIDVGLFKSQLSTILSSTAPLLSLLKTNFGIVGLLIMVYAAISDGILASLSFMLGTSRTVYAMSQRDMLPSVFTWLRNNEPIMASILTAFIYGIISFLGLATIKNPFYLFLELGALAGLANVFVHLSANFSLIFSSIRELKRRASIISNYAIRKIINFILTKIGDIIIGLVAALFSLIVLIYSLGTVNKIIENLFMGWIIIGFLYAEIVDSIKQNHNH
ncbi:MAG: APC family permease [Caldisphaera sp.]|uniref:APC family permease n=1 Tax=Caldisphaera sp. TaxID=2060322 RepID=UPI000CB7CB69|nr:MAG: APC family permease [Caldisphaera sp.]PMP90792.1 MAG: APC family permease [Caldisphaera sp.]